MRTLEIQVERNGEWRKVSTVLVESDNGDARQPKRRAGVMTAFRYLTAWHDSDQFSGLTMRIAEDVSLFGKPEFRIVSRILA